MDWPELYKEAEDFKTLEFIELFEKYNYKYSIDQIRARMYPDSRPKISYWYRKPGHETGDCWGMKYVTHYPNIEGWFVTAYME